MLNQRKRGQPKADIAQRAKAYCFQQALKNRSRLSNEELDQRFIVEPTMRLPHAKRHKKGVINRRVFEHIEKYGRDPDAKAALTQRGFSVVEMVANDPDHRFCHAANIYRSPLWDLLTPPSPTTDELNTLINDLLARNNLFRAKEEEIPVGNRFATDKEPFDWSGSESYRNSIKNIATTGTFDSVTLLCALYYEALHHNASGQLEAIRSVFDTSIMECECTYFLEKEAQLLIMWLCWNRIFSSRWEPLPDDEKREWARNHINVRREGEGLPQLTKDTFEVDRLGLRYYNGTTDHCMAIVPMTQELADIRNNLDMLNHQIQEENWFPRKPIQQA